MIPCWLLRGHHHLLYVKQWRCDLIIWNGNGTLALWNRPSSRHLTVNVTWHLEEFGWERVRISEEDLEFFIFVSLRTYLSSLSCTQCIRRLIRRRWESRSICYTSFRRHDKFSTFLKIYFHSVYVRLLPARMSAPHVYSQRPGGVHSGTELSCGCRESKPVPLQLQRMSRLLPVDLVCVL